MRRRLQCLAAIGLLAVLAAPSFAANWTSGSIDLTWELAPLSTAAKAEEFDATAACNYNANMAAGKQWEYGSPSISFEWQYQPDGSQVGDDQDTGTGGSGGGFSYKSQRTIVYNTASAKVDDKTVKVRAHVTGTITDYGPDEEKGTEDDVTYTIDQWSDWLEANLSIYTVAILQCPAYFVPGHENKVKYRIYPDGYTASYGKFEIFKRDENDDPTGAAVYAYSGDDLNKAGGTERTFTYSGTDINYSDERYVVTISIGQDSIKCSSDTGSFDVVAWDLLGFFWDVVTSSEKTAIDEADEQSFPGYDQGFDKYQAYDAGEDSLPYCAGIDLTTVTSSKVTVTVWYWDETENDALSLSMDNATGTSTISSSDWENEWGQDPEDKEWCDDRGAGIADLNGTFYSMSESNQYFYLKIVVASDGVIDNVDNPFDANTADETIQSTVRYKLKISGEGTLSFLETTYYE